MADADGKSREPSNPALHFDDPLEIQEAVTKYGWELEYTQLETGRFDGRVRAAELGDIGIEQVHWGRATQLRGVTQSDFVTVVLGLSVDAPPTFRGTDLEFDDLLFVRSGAEVDYVSRAPQTTIGVRVRESRFREAEHALLGSERLGRSTSTRLTKAEAQQIRLLAGIALETPDLGGNERAEIEDAIVTAVVHKLGADRTSLDVPPQNYAVAQAREFMHANLAGVVRMQDLSAASATPERTLRRAFRRALGVSPKAYLQFLRLRRARELLAQGPPSVTEAAQAAGFDHMGRFARQYHAMFGELPHETKARGERFRRAI